MQYKDYYKILGVAKNATLEEIKKAYKKLAVKYHPDRNPGNAAAEQRFKEISEAKEVLTNPENRQKYDMLGANWRQFQRTGNPGAGFGNYYRPGGSEPDLNNIFTNFFEDIFGGGRGRTHNRRGKNFEANVKISLEEAYTGMRDVLSYEGKKLRIHLRPGIKDGQRLRLKGQGGPGRSGGSAGDLYLTVKIKPHSRFERREHDLYTDLKVDLYTAVLGKKAQVNSIKGIMNINIPAGTQSGERLKLKGLGMPHYDNPTQFGDLYVKILVRTPKNLTKEERELFEKLAGLSGK